MSFGIFLNAFSSREDLYCAEYWRSGEEGFLLTVIRLKITFISEDIKMLHTVVTHMFHA